MNRTRSHLLPGLLAALLIFSSVAATSAEDLVLVENGAARYVIYYGEDEGVIPEHAALELGQWLDLITGATFSVTTDENDARPKIVVGRHNPLAASVADRLDYSAIHGDGFRILVHDENLYLVGAIDRGTLYAVYHFLDVHLGVRWFSPEFEVVPSRDTLTIPEMDDLQNPRFLYREIFSGDTDDAYFRQHNRLNGNRGETHREFLEYPEEIDTWSREGPWGGANFTDIVGSVYHSGGQIEAMNPAVRAQAADYFVERITEEGEEPWYAFSQEDNGWDPDPESADFADDHGGALSAPVVDLVTDVARRVRDHHPDAHLSTSAYQWSFAPPTGLSVPDFVLIEIAPIEADFGHPYDDSAWNRDTLDAFEGWKVIAPSLGVWDYLANFQNYLQPMPTLYPMFHNIQYLASMGNVLSYFGEGAYNTSGAEFAELRAWVAARLLWNPEQDFRALIHEFCEGYYGPSAAPLVEDYIDLLHRSFAENGDRISSKQRITSDYLGLDFVLQADQLLAQADAAASGPFSRHVHEVRMGLDMTILLREHMYAAEAAARGHEWVHDPERRRRFEEYTSEAGIEEYAEDGTLDELLAAMNIRRVNPPAPGIVSPGQDWIDYQDLDFSYCCGAEMVEDTLASDHGSIRLDNGEWAITLPLDLLPPGKQWTLYAFVRAETRPGADPGSIAFNMGTYPGSWISPTVEEVKDGAYHVFRFPEMPVAYRTGSDVWLSCETEQTNAIFVDRIVAVASGTAGPGGHIRSPGSRVLPPRLETTITAEKTGKHFAP